MIRRKRHLDATQKGWTSSREGTATATSRCRRSRKSRARGNGRPLKEGSKERSTSPALTALRYPVLHFLNSYLRPSDERSLSIDRYRSRSTGSGRSSWSWRVATTARGASPGFTVRHMRRRPAGGRRESMMYQSLRVGLQVSSFRILRTDCK